MLTDQDECVGEDIERYRKPSAGNTHHEFMLFQLFPPLFVYAHATMLASGGWNGVIRTNLFALVRKNLSVLS